MGKDSFATTGTEMDYFRAGLPRVLIPLMDRPVLE
jgi:hypothetical protein